MNFNQLKYIAAVDQYRNFGRAADECRVAQSTLSREIQRLEKEFGVIIFDRSRVPVTATMKGADLILSAKRILTEQRYFIEKAQQKTNIPQGNFKLGILPALAPYLLPLFISSLSEKYPLLDVEVLECSAGEMVMHFEMGRLDGIITFSPFVTEGYYEEKLFDERFVVYCAQKHPLFKHSQVNWDEVCSEKILLHSELAHYFFPEKETRNSNVRYESGSIETIRKVIDRNGGITILPELACQYMGARRQKMVRPIINPQVTLPVTLVTRIGFEKNRITKVIVREIMENLPLSTKPYRMQCPGNDL